MRPPIDETPPIKPDLEFVEAVTTFFRQAGFDKVADAIQEEVKTETYRIIRFHEDDTINKVIRRGLTLEELSLEMERQ